MKIDAVRERIIEVGLREKLLSIFNNATEEEPLFTVEELREKTGCPVVKVHSQLSNLIRDGLIDKIWGKGNTPALWGSKKMVRQFKKEVVVNGQ